MLSGPLVGLHIYMKLLECLWKVVVDSNCHGWVHTNERLSRWMHMGFAIISHRTHRGCLSLLLYIAYSIIIALDYIYIVPSAFVSLL